MGFGVIRRDVSLVDRSGDCLSRHVSVFTQMKSIQVKCLNYGWNRPLAPLVLRWVSLTAAMIMISPLSPNAFNVRLGREDLSKGLPPQFEHVRNTTES